MMENMMEDSFYQEMIPHEMDDGNVMEYSIYQERDHQFVFFTTP